MADTSFHFCIHGAGGLGSVIGGYLANAGHRATLIARPKHVDAIRKDGLRITGTRGEFCIRKNLQAVTHPSEVEGDIDYYILLTKAKGTAAALADAKVLVERVRNATTLQNGIHQEEALYQIFSKDQVFGASIMEAGVLVEPGLARNHMTVPTTAYFGELEGGVSERTEDIAAALRGADLGAKAVEDIIHVKWEKLVQVGGASAWAASTMPGKPELDFGDGLSVKEGAEHYATIAKELLTVYHAMGYKPQNFYAPVSQLKEIDALDFDAAVEHCLALGKRLSSQGRGVRTSMHEDVLAGRKTEVDEVLAPLKAAAERLGVAAPTFIGAYRVIKTLDHYLS